MKRNGNENGGINRNGENIEICVAWADEAAASAKISAEAEKRKPAI
jgi:hypothetical protein